jgi:hypothetical protein
VAIGLPGAFAEWCAGDSVEHARPIVRVVVERLGPVDHVIIEYR